MAITDDLRKTFKDPTPLYFAAGTADLALQQARKVPELVEQLRAEAPARIDAVRRTDPKAVQDKATARAREIQSTVQARVNGAIEQIQPDLRKLGETAQGLALRGVGVAFEYAVKARETYEKVAEHGEQTVKAWRGERAGQAPAAVSAPVAEPVVVETASESDLPGQSDGTTAPAASSASAASAASSTESSAAKKTTRKTTGTTGTAARRNGTKKTPPAK